jgi:hypothetical protein
MNSLVFACGLGALAQVATTFLVLIKRILTASASDGAMISRVIVKLLWAWAKSSPLRNL